MSAGSHTLESRSPHAIAFDSGREARGVRPGFFARRVPLPTDQSLIEEAASCATHAVGAVLSVVALVMLVATSAQHGDPWRIVSVSVFSATLTLLYTTSAIYHSLTQPTLKRVFRLLDHASIYLVIAGSYTPVTLVFMRGPWGWTLFGLAWFLAAVGIVTKIFIIGDRRVLSLGLYLGMGWLILVGLKPALRMVPVGLILWMLAGGLFYTLGVVFFAMRKLRFHHAVWHLFVMAGSACHFIGLLIYTGFE